MAASAAAEPRTSCPACGGQVHPIAGRCKHCKADLTRLRQGGSTAARPQLVALGGGAAAAASGEDRGHAAPGPAAAHGSTYAPMAPMAMPAHPPAHDPAPARATWSSRWPLLVAGIAVIAIVASVALLVFGGGEKKKSRAKRFDGPAPELTPTDPLPARPDPRALPHAGGTGPDLSDPSDPSGSSGPSVPPRPPPPSTRPTAGPRTAKDFFEAAIDVGCRRMTACSANDSMVATYCTSARQMLPQMVDSLDAYCSDYDGNAGKECLDAISRFPCPGGAPDADAIAKTLLNLSGCQQVCASAFAGGLGIP